MKCTPKCEWQIQPPWGELSCKLLSFLIIFFANRDAVLIDPPAGGGGVTTSPFDFNLSFYHKGYGMFCFKFVMKTLALIFLK